MAWQEWTTITSGKIISGSDLEQIQQNLDWLSNTGIQVNDSTGRCIGHYIAICATDNVSQKAVAGTNVTNSCSKNNAKINTNHNGQIGKHPGRYPCPYYYTAHAY